MEKFLYYWYTMVMKPIHEGKGKYIAFGIIVIVLAILACVFFFHMKPAEPVIPVSTEPVVIASVVQDPVDKQINETAELYDLSIHYPEFSIPAVDAEIMRYMNTAQTEFKKAFTPIDDTLRDAFPEGSKGSLTITFEIRKSKGITTVVFRGSEYTGGAHPNPFIFTIHIGDDGKLLELKDVFTVATPTYLEILSKRATAQFSKDYGDAFFEEGSTSNPENWNQWYIEQGKLVVLFTVYQVTAYANGEPELFVPLSELKDIINPVFIQ